MAQHEVDPLREFDDLLQQELSVTPSPEFLSRVREAVRAEPARNRWSLFALRSSLFALRGSLISLAAAAVIVLAAGLSLYVGEDQRPTPPASPSIAGFHARPAVPNEPAPLPLPKTPSGARRTTNNEQRTTNSEQRTPEVLVDQRQRAALVSMLRLINQGQVTEDSFKTTTPAPAEIGVDPVAVSPIVVGGVLPSESDRK